MTNYVLHCVASCFILPNSSFIHPLFNFGNCVHFCLRKYFYVKKKIGLVCLPTSQRHLADAIVFQSEKNPRTLLIRQLAPPQQNNWHVKNLFLRLAHFQLGGTEISVVSKSCHSTVLIKRQCYVVFKHQDKRTETV